ncbi:MAG: hypothetical protein ACRD3M_08035 [Thermoanaerobaculia bacterium]
MKGQAPVPLLLLWAACVWAAPTATPTPAAPKLSGGFGRPQSTPAVPPGQTGQTLADLVRAASQSRQGKETPRPSVAITNETLVTDPKRGRLTTWQGAPRASTIPAGTPAAGSLPPAAAVSPTATAEQSPASEEARWQETARRARERVAHSKERVSLLAAEAKKLENDFYAWDDGQYRDNVIKPAWDKKREELETARRELEAAEKDLADLPEKARKAGALPGWIRE